MGFPPLSSPRNSFRLPLSIPTQFCGHTGATHPHLRAKKFPAAGNTPRRGKHSPPREHRPRQLDGNQAGRASASRPLCKSPNLCPLRNWACLLHSPTSAPRRCRRGSRSQDERPSFGRWKGRNGTPPHAELMVIRPGAAPWRTKQAERTPGYGRCEASESGGTICGESFGNLLRKEDDFGKYA
jgi:hypothetical protein